MPDCTCLSPTAQYIQFGVILVLALTIIYNVYQSYVLKQDMSTAAAASFAVYQRSPFAVSMRRERATNGSRGGKYPQLTVDSEFVRGGLSSGADIRFLAAGQGTGSAENFLGGPEPPVMYDYVDRPPAVTTVMVGGKPLQVSTMDAAPVGGVVLNELNTAAYTQEGLVSSRVMGKSRGFDAAFDNALRGM